MKCSLIFLLALTAGAATSILVPDTSLAGAQILACSGTNPTTCTLGGLFTQPVPAFQLNDLVNVQGILENPSGTVYRYSTMNSALGVQRKICYLSGISVRFCDLSGNPVNAANPVLNNSGLVRRATVGTVNPGPIGPLNGPGGKETIGLSCTIMDSCLTGIAVASNVATATYAYAIPFSSGVPVQVRNCTAASALNGVHTVTVTGAYTFTFPTSGVANGTYTDANMGISYFAVTGSLNWSRALSAIQSFNFSTYVSAPVPWPSGPGFPGEDLVAAATYWYIDRTQTAALAYAKSAIDNTEDYFETPERCDTSSAFCANEGQQNDYSRAAVPSFMYAYTLIHSQLSGTEIQNFANFFLDNDFALGATCNQYSSTSYEAGTITVSGTSVTGSGTTFTNHHVGDYVGYYTYALLYGRIASIASDTSMTFTSSPSNGSGASWWGQPPNNKSTDCGYTWYAAAKVANDTIDPRVVVPSSGPGWPGQPGAGLGDTDYIQSSGNNQVLTSAIQIAATGATLCRDDVRACLLLQQQIMESWDTDVVDYLGWGGYTKTGDYYASGRTVPYMATLLTELANATSFTGFTTLLQNSIGFRTWLLQKIYLTAPASQTNYTDSDLFLGWTYEQLRYFNDENPIGTDLTVMYAAGFASQTEVAYMQNYYTSVFSTYWNNPPAAGYIGLGSLAFYDPNWPSTSFLGKPTQLMLSATSNNLCTSLGVTCAGVSYLGGISRSDWGWTARPAAPDPGTLLEDEVMGQDADHGSLIAGSLQLISGPNTNVGSYTTSDVLVMDQDQGATFQGVATGLNLGTVALATFTTASGLGLNKPETSGTLLRFSGAAANAQFGTSSDYYSATWDLTSLYGFGGAALARNIQSRAHLKKAGYDQWLFTYRDISGGPDTKEWDDNFITWGAYTSYSSGTVTVTNPDNYRLIGKWLSPAGSNSIAVNNDGTSYSNRVNGSRVRVCASANGSACLTAPSTLEDLQVVWLGTSATNNFTLSSLAPDSNWTGAVAIGPTSVAVGLFARGGTTHSTLTSFSTSFSGNGQWLISGLAAGTWTVTVGGTPVSGSPFTVSAGDNTVEFLSTSGVLSAFQSGGPICSITTGSLPTGTVNVAYSQTIATANCVSPIAWSISSGALCGGLTLGGSTGLISGTPTTAQTCGFTVQAVDSAPTTTTYPLSITINPGVASIPTSIKGKGTISGAAIIH